MEVANRRQRSVDRELEVEYRHLRRATDRGEVGCWRAGEVVDAGGGGSASEEREEVKLSLAKTGYDGNSVFSRPRDVGATRIPLAPVQST